MTLFDASAYGDKIADVYDDWYRETPESIEPAVSFLAELARGGRALELGVGTGRVAIPLAARGIEVHGIEASEAMAARLRAKPGSDRVSVTVADMTEVGVDGTFALIFAALSTIFGPPSHGDQARCFRNVAARLTGDGVFVVEASVPDAKGYLRDNALDVLSVGAERVLLLATKHERLAQRVTGQYVLIGEDGIRMIPVQIRYAFPAELDLMADLAGLRLRERWASWQRDPFTASSTAHVSVYERA